MKVAHVYAYVYLHLEVARVWGLDTGLACPPAGSGGGTLSVLAVGRAALECAWVGTES
jgi:hypothetical protein